MDLKELARTISGRLKEEEKDVRAYEDYYRVCMKLKDENRKLGVMGLKWLSGLIGERMGGIVKEDVGLGRELMGIHRRVLLGCARWDFESYLLYTEWEREPEKKFYVPRQKQLRAVVEQMQRLADDELDLLAISMPPGTGKSTLALFYLTWLAGREPDLPILTGSHSTSWTRGAYDECLRMVDKSGEYLWSNVFPEAGAARTNARDYRIDLGREKRFETMQFTSVGTGNAGLYRAVQLLYCDDLVSGIEEAMSKERLDKLWDIYNTDLRQRKQGAKCKELHIATRWSVWDVLGRLESEYGESPRAKFIVMPAMDENDESNFDYPYGVGFSTKFYREQREVMDDVNWRALYMNQPIEREGLLYAEEELRRYFELPDGEPDAIVAVCDTKDKGPDYFVMPVAYQYGNDFYIEDVVCDNGNPDTVEPKLVDILVENRVHLARFESNQAGGRIASNVQEKVKEKGGRCKITTKYTTANKETKIIVAQPWVVNHCLFKDDSVTKGNREYRRFMKFLTGYTLAGKNKHDDVPDAMAQLAEFIQSYAGNKVEIVKRPF